MEHEFHRWLKAQTRPEFLGAPVLIGIGDDAAVLSLSDESVVITTDTIAEGTHFELAKHSLPLIGRKSLAVNLSDLAAMAARPVATVLTFLLPRSFEIEQLRQLYSGVAELADEFGVAIVGGDTNTWDGKLVVGATVIGQKAQNQTGWLIGGARAGDQIVVSGSFGGSIHGRHLSFCPRIQLALYLAEHYQINAATDASDSLSLDLNAMATSSGVGIDLRSSAIPISSNVQEIDRVKALQHSLFDGEDFELILAVRQSEIERLMSDPNVPCRLSWLGSTTDQHSEIRLTDDGKTWTTLTPQGYIH